MKAVLRTIRISPKKANLVAGMVRGKKVNEALPLLKFMPKKGARIIYDVVLSAASNAKNNFKQKMDELVITRILVTKGPTYKRSVPISRGRVHPIRKRTAHITVEVGVPGAKAPVSIQSGEVVKKVEKKAPAKTVANKEKETVKKEVVKKESVKKEGKKPSKKNLKND